MLLQDKTLPSSLMAPSEIKAELPLIFFLFFFKAAWLQSRAGVRIVPRDHGLGFFFFLVISVKIRLPSQKAYLKPPLSSSQAKSFLIKSFLIMKTCCFLNRGSWGWGAGQVC